jgi:hypothetical protein
LITLLTIANIQRLKEREVGKMCKNVVLMKDPKQKRVEEINIALNPVVELINYDIK